MRLDVWNNPIVVSAMRQKYRRGSPRLMLSTYVAAMLALGALLHHYSASGGYPFASTYLFVMLAVQFVLSGGIALFGTGKSINAEVVNQTLDFQRIVSLDPRTILVGKMLGEPASSYLMAAATVPIAVICWALSGSAGAAILCCYLNLATWTLLCASIGLIHPLAAPSTKPGGRRAGAGGVFFLLFIFIPQMLVQGAGMLDVPGIGEAIQLLTPLGWFVHVFQGNMSASAAWDSTIGIWGFTIPSLLAAPVAQLLVAATIVAGMSRRLDNVNNPPLKKVYAYAILGVLDILLAGICYAHLPTAGVIQLIYCYFLVHYVSCIILLFAIVPGRMAVSSWVWRHCDGRAGAVDRLAGDRYEITFAALAMALLGVIAAYAGLVLPINAQAAAGQPAIAIPFFAEIAAAMVVFVVSSGIVHQIIALLVQKNSNMLYIFFLFAVNAAPPTVAALIDALNGPREEMAEVVRGLVSLSPIGYFGSNLSTLSGQYASAVPPIAAYGCLAALARIAMVRWLRREHSVVRGKLVAMGVN